MASVRTPLLASPGRRSEEEDEALLRPNDGYYDDNNNNNNNNNGPTPAWRSVRLREILLFAWALVATAAVIVLAVWVQHHNATTGNGDGDNNKNHHHKGSGGDGSKAGKRNLVFMVSDGMGPTSLSLTRSFRQLVDGLPIDDTLALDRHFWGTSRTRSSSSLVTDSAAGATAFACGRKSYNGAISMLPDHTPCGTVLEAAKRAGYATGLVVTTDVTDATPACFASHVYWRSQEDEIALQEVGERAPLGRVVDLIFGGGRCHFLPNSTAGSCRADDLDVAALAQRKHGWSYADDRAGFDAMRGGRNLSLPALGLFAGADVPFEIDRRRAADTYPSLSEMAAAALTALSEATADSDKGFFLMIEGSRIDHAGHINDPAAQVHEVLEFDKAFRTVLDFLAESDTEGVVVSTSDHETGGLATAWQSPDESPVYKWDPSVLASVQSSAQHLSHLLREHVSSHPDLLLVARSEELKAWINENLVVGGLGITDAHDGELGALAATPGAATTLFAQMVSQRARVGWSTHGHSAVDVNIYSGGSSSSADALRGNVENTDVGKFLHEYLDVDVDAITRELRDKMPFVSSAAGSMMNEGYSQNHPEDWLVEQHQEMGSVGVDPMMMVAV